MSNKHGDKKHSDKSEALAAHQARFSESGKATPAAPAAATPSALIVENAERVRRETEERATTEANRPAEAATPAPAPAPGPTVEETVERALAAQRAELEEKHAKDIETERVRTAGAITDALERQRSEHETELELERAAHRSDLEKTRQERTTPLPGNRRQPAPLEGGTGVFVTRKALLDAGACGPGLESFNRRVGPNESGYEWTPAEALRVYQRAPRFLHFLESRDIVPHLEVDGMPSVETRREKMREARRAQRRGREHAGDVAARLVPTRG